MVANLDLRTARIGVFPNKCKILLGDRAFVHDSQADTVDCITKANDWGDGLGALEQFEVRFWSNQTDLSSPSKKGFPSAD